VHLNYREDWSQATPQMNESGGYEAWKKVWHKGTLDEHMAAVARREFIERGHKALIYCGLHHAFTRYKQPETDEKNTRALRFMDRRTGNLLRAYIGDRVCTIGLHAPWTRRDGGYEAPVRGLVDRAVAESGLARVGFDVYETPLGELGAPDVIYAVGYSDFRFGYLADGWVWLAPFERYEGCTVDEGFITPANLEEARGLVSPAERAALKTVADFVREMRAGADFERARRKWRNQCNASLKTTGVRRGECGRLARLCGPEAHTPWRHKRGLFRGTTPERSTMRVRRPGTPVWPAAWPARTSGTSEPGQVPRPRWNEQGYRRILNSAFCILPAAALGPPSRFPRNGDLRRFPRDGDFH
jgi:hypothetical protein